MSVLITNVRLSFQDPTFGMMPPLWLSRLQAHHCICGPCRGGLGVESGKSREKMPKYGKSPKFRVGQVDSNDICRRVTETLSIPSHEFSSLKRSGTAKFAVSGSGKKGKFLVFTPEFGGTHISGFAEERKSFSRMFGARKACYKCGNGVSEPPCIIRV